MAMARCYLIVALCAMQAQIVRSGWACSSVSGWLDFKDAGGAKDKLVCVALGDGSIVTYATTLAHCNAAVTCMNDWPTYYTEDYGTIPACDTFVAGAEYGDLAGTYYVLHGGTGGACPVMARGIDSAEVCGDLNTCTDREAAATTATTATTAPGTPSDATSTKGGGGGEEDKEADALFTRLDTNTDGALSADEISKGLRG
eukprot:gene23534-901_t